MIILSVSTIVKYLFEFIIIIYADDTYTVILTEFESELHDAFLNIIDKANIVLFQLFNIMALKMK